MVMGVSQGFQKSLEIQGVGFRAQVQGNKSESEPRFLAPGGVSDSGRDQNHGTGKHEDFDRRNRQTDGRPGGRRYSGVSTRRSPIKAKASATPANRSGARKAKRSNNGDGKETMATVRSPKNTAPTGFAKSGGHDGTSASLGAHFRSAHLCPSDRRCARQNPGGRVHRGSGTSGRTAPARLTWRLAEKVGTLGRGKQFTAKRENRGI